MPQVNPEILVWARETAGLTIEEAAHKIPIRKLKDVTPVERLERLESGEEAPTRGTLRNMAAKYRRPLLTFYLAQIPPKGKHGKDFRKLPEIYSATDEALLDALIRDVVARQGILRSALEDDEDTEPCSFVGSLSSKMGVKDCVSVLRTSLEVSEVEFWAQPSPIQAFELLRSSAKEAGIFAILMGDLGSHQSTVSIDLFRGLALADPVAPFIVINSNDSKPAMSFSLLHELVHIGLGATGISGGNSDDSTEVFCNRIAGQFLLPNTEIAKLGELGDDIETASLKIKNFAGQRNISQTMVALRLYHTGIIDYERYDALARKFRMHWNEFRKSQREKNRQADGGPSYYVLRRQKLGEGFLNLVDGMHRAGSLSTVKAGKLLGVRARNVGDLLSNDIAPNPRVRG